MNSHSNRQRVITPNLGIPVTKQSFKNECDINRIMARYTKTGVIEHLNRNKPEYGFAPEVDFRQALELIDKASDMFDKLPAKIRAKFDNDPGKFLGFVENPENRSEAALMGLLNEEATLEEAEKLEASDSASAPVPPAPETAPTPE